jgi:hypothetical protein
MSHRLRGEHAQEAADVFVHVTIGGHRQGHEGGMLSLGKGRFRDEGALVVRIRLKFIFFFFLSMTI